MAVIVNVVLVDSFRTLVLRTKIDATSADIEESKTSNKALANTVLKLIGQNGNFTASCMDGSGIFCALASDLRQAQNAPTQSYTMLHSLDCLLEGDTIVVFVEPVSRKTAAVLSDAQAGSCRIQ